MTRHDTAKRAADLRNREEGIRAVLSGWGYILHVAHFRRFEFSNNLYTRHQMPAVPEPKGGLTEVTILDQNGSAVAIARAKCSIQDNYDRRVGRVLALERAYDAVRGWRAAA